MLKGPDDAARAIQRPRGDDLPARDQGPDKAIAKALGTFFREAKNATGQKASRFSLKVLCG